MFFFGNLSNEEMVNTMHVLLLYLQSAPDDAKPLVAILLLHFDLLVYFLDYSFCSFRDIIGSWI